ncbi:MAG TPA: hypothetical protein VGL02_02965, partial [Streptomyces sp.]
VHSSARGWRHALNVIFRFIREITRDAIDINFLVDLLDVSYIGHFLCRIARFPGEGRATMG